jgi:hypothetical protein
MNYQPVSPALFKELGRLEKSLPTPHRGTEAEDTKKREEKIAKRSPVKKTLAAYKKSGCGYAGAAL